MKLENGELVVKIPRRNSPLDDAELAFERLHAVGVVRALAGALDCVAGAVIGVAALHLGILKADFSQLREFLRKRIPALPRPLTEGESVQENLAAKLETIVAQSGPAGWLDWTLALRNMLVHRGRRIQMGELVQRLPLLYGPQGEPVPRVRVVTHPSADPSRSDIEVLLDGAMTPVLTEDVERTLAGLVGSTRKLVDDLGRELLEVWHWRRANPAKLEQPKLQWRDGPSTTRLNFAGYAPGSYPYNPTELISNKVLGQRLLAAALDDGHRAEWQAFD